MIIEFHEQYDSQCDSYMFTTFTWIMITWRTLIIIIIIRSSLESHFTLEYFLLYQESLQALTIKLTIKQQIWKIKSKTWVKQDTELK